MAGGEAIVTLNFQRSPFGHLKVWQEPLKDHEYIMGVDVAQGRLRDVGKTTRIIESAEQARDFSCAMVIDKVGCQLCASWHGTINTHEFTYVLYYLGLWYGTALIAVERDGGYGSGVIANLIPTEYPAIYCKKPWGKIPSSGDEQQSAEYGWKTDVTSRGIMIAGIHEMIAAADEEIPDRELLLELQTMQLDKEGKPRGIGKNKDDRVFAYGIALAVRNEVLYQGQEEEAVDKYKHLKWADKMEWQRVDREMEPAEGEGGKPVDVEEMIYADE